MLNLSLNLVSAGQSNGEIFPYPKTKMIQKITLTSKNLLQKWQRSTQALFFTIWAVRSQPQGLQLNKSK